jgi:phage repressor protein C with HTH and peptisase S24 domain
MSRSSETSRKEAVAANTPARTDQNSFVARLQSIVRHWPSTDRLARATGVSPSAFRKWLRGEAEPSRERLVALAQAAGVSTGWLANGEGPEPSLQGLNKETRSRLASLAATGVNAQEFVLLPRHAEAAAAGLEAPPSSAPVGAEFMALRHDWVRSVLGIDPERVQIETALGESMLPGIQDGDLLFIDTGEQGIQRFGLYVLEIAGERFVKRVQPKLDGSVTLISDNGAYEAEHVPAERIGELRVVGRVLWILGPTRGSRRFPP